MVYIRVKNISSKPYAYAVKNITTSRGPRQKVVQYLGRIHIPERCHDNRKTDIYAKSKAEFLQKLVLINLENHGFRKGKNEYSFHDIIFNEDNFTLMKKNKDAVVAFNDGYLCDFTIQRLLHFKKSKNLDRDAYTLAKYFLEAGLPLSQEQFVQFYQL